MEMEFVDGLVFLFLFQIRSMKRMGSMMSAINRDVTIGITRNLCFRFGNCKEHVGKCRSGMPPQSLPLPLTEIAVVLAKTPKVGTSPTRSLNERLR